MVGAGWGRDIVVRRNHYLHSNISPFLMNNDENKRIGCQWSQWEKEATSELHWQLAYPEPRHHKWTVNYWSQNLKTRLTGQYSGIEVSYDIKNTVTYIGFSCFLSIYCTNWISSQHFDYWIPRIFCHKCWFLYVHVSVCICNIKSMVTHTERQYYENKINNFVGIAILHVIEFDMNDRFN